MFLYFNKKYSFFYVMNKYRFKICKEDNLYVPYKKRFLFGWKRLTVTGLNTIYLAIKFISDNYKAPIFNENSSDLEIQL